jgi:hypothetical protein
MYVREGLTAATWVALSAAALFAAIPLIAWML